MDDQSTKIVQDAFKHNENLQIRILHAAKHFQDGIPELLRDISTFVLSLQQSGQATQPANGEPSSKKRKLEQPSESAGNGTNGAGSYEILNAEIDFECKDVSFTSPLRKKLRLQLLHESANKLNQQLRLIDQTTGEIVYTLRGQDIDCVFCLPVPEKAQRQQCFIVFPLPGSQSSDGTPAEPLVWTTNETKGQPDAVSVSTRIHRGEEDTFVDVTRGELDHFMASLSKKTILPDEREFASEIPQSHRKGEKAFHTKAFRGSKEGYLYLLSTGIVFGFKKPVAFFPFSAIDSISFTSVLQRTFNIVITTSDPANPDSHSEHELSMVDQADFAPIDAYIRAHGLNDASMAAERRAKIHNVNKPTADEEAAAANGEVQDGRSEIQKAEEAAQDAEDEEEEDYDPSGGESEGSVEDSDEEEEGYEDGEGEDEEEEWDEDEEVGGEEEAKA